MGGMVALPVAVWWRNSAVCGRTNAHSKNKCIYLHWQATNLILNVIFT